MSKKYRVVMLPTKSKEGSKLFTFREKIDFYYKEVATIDETIAQHLYIISNEEIKEGEYMYSYEFNTVFKASYNTTPSKDYWKVIASTYPSLNLPGIQQSFLEKYVAAQGKITEVELEIDKEYEDWYEQMELTEFPGYQLKLSPNNEVIVVELPTKKEYITQFDDQSINFNRTDEEWNKICEDDQELDYIDELDDLIDWLVTKRYFKKIVQSVKTLPTKEYIKMWLQNKSKNK